MHYRFLIFCLFSVALSGCFNPFPQTGGGGSSGYPTDGRGTNGTGDDAYGQSGPSGPSTSADKGVRVDDIRLTRDYTIMYMTFTDNKLPAYDQNGRVMRSGTTIAFRSSGQLVAANGARIFKFIKAENIPVDPEKQYTYGGKSYSFAIYFERLDKGLENFDLFDNW